MVFAAWFDNVSGGENPPYEVPYLCVGKCVLTHIRLLVQIHGGLLDGVLPECLGSASMAEAHHSGWLMGEVLSQIVRPACGIHEVWKCGRAKTSYHGEINNRAVGVWHLIRRAKGGGASGGFLFTMS